MASRVAAVATEDTGCARPKDDAALAGREEGYEADCGRMTLTGEDERGGEPSVEHLITWLPGFVYLLVRIKAVEEDSHVWEDAITGPERGQVRRAVEARVDHVLQRWRGRRTWRRRAWQRWAGVPRWRRRRRRRRRRWWRRLGVRRRRRWCRRQRWWRKRRRRWCRRRRCDDESYTDGRRLEIVP